VLTRRVPTPQQRWADLERSGWWRALTHDRIRLVGEPAADPGNPPWFLLLVEDPTGWLGDCRVLLGVNGTASPDGAHDLVALPVPACVSHPLAAAAWLADDESHPVRVTAQVIATTVNRT